MTELLSAVERVLSASSDLRDLRNRLAAIDEERTFIEQQIQARLADIAAAAMETAPARPAAVPVVAIQKEVGISERILAVLYTEPERVFTALDLGKIFGAMDDGTVNTYRAALSRLNAQGKISKVGYGKYSGTPSSSNAGGETAA